MLLSLIGGTAPAQTTNTNCTSSGNQVNCTSTQDNSYENGRAVGAGVGALIFGSIAKHKQVSNYCKFHPGESWHTQDYSRAGTCKPAKVKSVPVSSSFRFVRDSPEAIEWCSHQRVSMTYTALDGVAHACSMIQTAQTPAASIATSTPVKQTVTYVTPEVVLAVQPQQPIAQPPSTAPSTTVAAHWIFDGYTSKVQDGISCQYLSSKPNDGRRFAKTVPGPDCPIDLPMD